MISALASETVVNDQSVASGYAGLSALGSPFIMQFACTEQCGWGHPVRCHAIAVSFAWLAALLLLLCMILMTAYTPQ